MPTKFRKRPVEVEAVRWTGDNEAELSAFAGSCFEAVDPEDRDDDPDMTGSIYDKLHSTWVKVYTGQWVIKGIRGEFYPIDEMVLAETYDQVSEVWVAVYGRNREREERDCASLTEALDFLHEGESLDRLSAEQILGPDGKVVLGTRKLSDILSWGRSRWADLDRPDALRNLLRDGTR